MKKRHSKKQIKEQGKPITKKASGMYDASVPYNRRLEPFYVHTNYNSDHDFNVTEYDLALIRSRARDLFANTPALRNAIAQIASFSISDAWLMEMATKDKEYNKAANNFVNKNWIPLIKLHEKLRLIVKAVLRDGDVLIVLTKSKDGTYPKIQLIPAHRIANGSNGSVMKTGPYAGLNIVKGVIVNAEGEPVAYNIVNNGIPDQQISAFNVVLASEFDEPIQFRGESALKNCIKTWEDINQVNAFELQGIAVTSATALIINAPSGVAQDLASQGVTNPMMNEVPYVAPNGTTQPIKETKLKGGKVMVFDNSQGVGTMEQINTNRPTQNVQAFIENLVRHAMLSLGWPMEFSINLEMGGATAKTIIGVINERVSEVQTQIILPVWYRIMKYVIGVASKNGYIPSHPEWYNFNPTFPKKFAYDQFKDVKSAIELYKLGIISATQLCASEGYNHEEVQDQKYNELKAAHDRTDKKPVRFEELVQLTPNLNSPTAEPTTPEVVEPVKENI